MNRPNRVTGNRRCANTTFGKQDAYLKLVHSGYSQTPVGSQERLLDGVEEDEGRLEIDVDAVEILGLVERGQQQFQGFQTRVLVVHGDGEGQGELDLFRRECFKLHALSRPGFQTHSLITSVGIVEARFDELTAGVVLQPLAIEGLARNIPTCHCPYTPGVWSW